MSTKRVMVISGLLALYAFVFIVAMPDPKAADYREAIKWLGLLNYATFVVAVLALVRK